MEKQAETRCVVIRKNWDTEAEFIDMDSFDELPAGALLKSHSAARFKGDVWATDNPITRTAQVFIKEL